MSSYGLLGVDWEERIDFSRLRRERLEKAKKAVIESGVELLFIFRPEDVRYVTGFRSHLGPVGYYGSHVVVLPNDGDPVLYTMDYVFAKATMSWMKIENIEGPRPWRGPAEIALWAEKVKKRFGDISGKIGVDIWELSVERELRRAFPNAEFVDGREILFKAKIIKTRDEIECLKAAYAITEAGLEAALEALKPGVKECEVLAEAWRAMTALGSEWTQCANIVSSGPYTAPYRRFTSDRIIRNGDLVIIDIGGCYNGYWGDLTRTYICGNAEPTKEQKALYQEAYNALFEACAASRPGNTTADVWRRLNNEHSMDLSTGHGSGTGPWEPPYFSPASEREPVTLEPGMAFNLEPYAGIIGIGGVRLENNVVVTENGPDIFSTFPFDSRLVEEVHPLDKTTGRVFKYRYE